LHGVRILILVHKDIFETRMVLRQHAVCGITEDRHKMQQQIAEVACIQRDQSFLIAAIKIQQLAA
jgi:hypothetical protein